MCFSNECCSVFAQTSPCQAFDTSYSSTSTLEKGERSCFVPSLSDVGCEMSLKPPRSCFSPKCKELCEPGKPKCLQMWKWAGPQEDHSTAFVMVLNHNRASCLWLPFGPEQPQLPSPNGMVWSPQIYLPPCCKSSVRPSGYSLGIWHYE